MFKFTPINSLTLRNLHNSQIYFSNPLNFNDPFDSSHPYELSKLSYSKFVSLFCKSTERDFNQKQLLEILDKSISKKDLIDFCNKHFDYFFDFEKLDNYKLTNEKKLLLNQIKNVDETTKEFVDIIGNLFSSLISKMNDYIEKHLNILRLRELSKLGVCCFSKNNTNLLMWAHYADCHKGICLEFDPKVEPFSKAYNVEYSLQIPELNSDLLFDEKENSEYIQKLISFKSIDWKYEEEMRILHHENDKCYNYSIESLKAIYFGLKTNVSDIEMICSIIKSKTQDVKFYQMQQVEKKFEIEPKQFYYSTPIEVQSTLFLFISRLFANNQFSVDELFDKIKLEISKIQLEIHLNDLSRKQILVKENLKYKLNI